MNEKYKAELKAIMLEVMRECDIEISCPLLSPEHTEQHELIAEWIKFFRDTRLEIRQSLVMSVPKIIHFIFWAMIIGVIVLISTGLARLGIR